MSRESYRLMQERNRLNLPQPLVSPTDALEMVVATIGREKAIYGLGFPPDRVTVKNVWATLDAYHIDQRFYDYQYSIAFSIYTGEMGVPNFIMV